jgi:hypothetical protein
MGETSLGNAKRALPAGRSTEWQPLLVQRNLGDCLRGSRGRMRMSVCEETGPEYLTRTEDLTSVHTEESGVA